MAGNFGPDIETEIEIELVSDEELALFDRLMEDAENAKGDREEPLSQPSDQSSAKSNPRIPAPLERLRGGLGYISVSDLTAQFWCEQQMEYSYELPPVPVTPAMQQGADIHLARELELHDVVQVEVASKEDKWAIVCLNCITQLAELDARQKVREMPVFGKPFGMGMFIYGIIDEIFFNETGEPEILELKTRAKSARLPSTAQQKRTELQVMLYMKLLNDVLFEKTTPDDFVSSLGLAKDKKLSEDPITFATRHGIFCITFGDILNALFMRIQCTNVSEVKCAIIEYCAQEDCRVMKRKRVSFDEKWLEMELGKLLSYWKGERPTTGVEIEEAWKCLRCDFADICTWRMKKEEECRNANTATKNEKTNLSLSAMET